MEGKEIFERVMNESNELFGKIFDYNSILLERCNDSSYEPSYEEIFDFYITSHAMTFLKNFYYSYIEAPSIFLNARCIIEGLALKEAFRSNYFDEFNLEFLKKQDALIEYKQYKKFKEIYENFLIPDELKEKYDESYEFYKKTLCSTSEADLKKIVNSQIPFVCDPKLSYRQIIEDNLGSDFAMRYSLISTIIHPTSNEKLTTKGDTFTLLNTFELLKREYSKLPRSQGDLRTLSMFIFSSKDAEKFNDLIKAECTQLENIQHDFEKNFGNNYVSDTFHTISMSIQEMMFDSVFGFSEQVKSKWKTLVELLSGFYEVYLNNDDVDNSYRMLQYHEDVSIARSVKNEEEEDKALNKAYEHYKKKYPNGVDFDCFKHKFIMTSGFTIDEEGKVKSLTQLVNQLADLFDNEDTNVSYSDAIKLNYVEAQMISHANGYLWFANSGAWGDTNGLFYMFNSIMSFICFYLSNIYKDGYEETKQYKDKKTSNICKQAGKFIRDNTVELSKVLARKNGSLFPSDKPKTYQA